MARTAAERATSGYPPGSPSFFCSQEDTEESLKRCGTGGGVEFALYVMLDRNAAYRAAELNGVEREARLLSSNCDEYQVPYWAGWEVERMRAPSPEFGNDPLRALPLPAYDNKPARLLPLPPHHPHRATKHCHYAFSVRLLHGDEYASSCRPPTLLYNTIPIHLHSYHTLPALVNVR